MRVFTAQGWARLFCVQSAQVWLVLDSINVTCIHYVITRQDSEYEAHMYYIIHDVRGVPLMVLSCRKPVAGYHLLS